MTDTFVALEAKASHNSNTYSLYMSGEDPETNFQVVDPETGGKYMLIMDRAHPVGLIFNEGEFFVKGLTAESLVEKYLGGE